ncbi:MAG TPA: response regulator [Deltaproteobacteria bacterium]|nr:response regulator [Deltaproteobacteria bacterium]
MAKAPLFLSFFLWSLIHRTNIEMKENRKQKIFIIDDDEDVRWTLGNILQSEGYEIEECKDSETAMQMLKTSEPDLVLLGR